MKDIKVVKDIQVVGFQNAITQSGAVIMPLPEQYTDGSQLKNAQKNGIVEDSYVLIKEAMKTGKGNKKAYEGYKKLEQEICFAKKKEKNNTNIVKIDPLLNEEVKFSKHLGKAICVKNKTFNLSNECQNAYVVGAVFPKYHASPNMKFYQENLALAYQNAFEQLEGCNVQGNVQLNLGGMQGYNKDYQMNAEDIAEIQAGAIAKALKQATNKQQLSNLSFTVICPEGFNAQLLQNAINKALNGPQNPYPVNNQQQVNEFDRRLQNYAQEFANIVPNNNQNYPKERQEFSNIKLNNQNLRTGNQVEEVHPILEELERVARQYGNVVGGQATKAVQYIENNKMRIAVYFSGGQEVVFPSSDTFDNIAKNMCRSDVRFEDVLGQLSKQQDGTVIYPQKNIAPSQPNNQIQNNYGFQGNNNNFGLQNFGNNIPNNPNSIFNDLVDFNPRNNDVFNNPLYHVPPFNPEFNENNNNVDNRPSFNVDNRPSFVEKTGVVPPMLKKFKLLTDKYHNGTYPDEICESVTYLPPGSLDDGKAGVEFTYKDGKTYVQPADNLELSIRHHTSREDNGLGKIPGVEGLTFEGLAEELKKLPNQTFKYPEKNVEKNLGGRGF